jgi:hypothetical protein
VPRARKRADFSLSIHIFSNNDSGHSMMANLDLSLLETARIARPQQLLFPYTPRGVCEELGLNWWAAMKLYDDGWLSFSPEGTARLDEGQEAELRFVGSLVMAGCDRLMLTSLLESLPKPYAYDVHKLYYDWAGKTWRLLPDPKENPEAAFADWLEALVETGDFGSLTGILELTHDALARVRSQPQPRR